MAKRKKAKISAQFCEQSPEEIEAAAMKWAAEYNERNTLAYLLKPIEAEALRILGQFEGMAPVFEPGKKPRMEPRRSNLPPYALPKWIEGQEQDERRANDARNVLFQIRLLKHQISAGDIEHIALEALRLGAFAALIGEADNILAGVLNRKAVSEGGKAAAAKRRNGLSREQYITKIQAAFDSVYPSQTAKKTRAYTLVGKNFKISGRAVSDIVKGRR